MIATAELKSQTRRELADIARDAGVTGWHSMRKDELIAEIKKLRRRQRKPSSKPTKSSPKSPAASSDRGKANRRSQRSAGGKSTTSRLRRSAASSRSSLNGPVPEMPGPKVEPKAARAQAHQRRRRETTIRNKDISTGTLVAGAAVRNGSRRVRAEKPHNDRIVLVVRDAYWLQATWEITQSSVARAEASMGQRWHGATPMLRLTAVGDVDSNGAESILRDIPIHGGVDTWYIDVDEPPSRFRIQIGYLALDDTFHTICRSNVVETPRPNACERLDEHWHDIAEDYERIYSLSGGYETDTGDLKEVFEERLRRPMPIRGDKGQTLADRSLLKQVHLPFDVDAELIVFGKTDATATVNVAGRPVKLQPDGSFTVRLELPDKRQVLPVTAESRDGMRQRTTVVAVERNTKVMEAVELDDKI